MKTRRSNWFAQHVFRGFPLRFPTIEVTMKINSDGMPPWVAILLVAISLIVTTLLIHRSNYIVLTAGFILAMSLNILDRAT